jgi:hypothetical protein
VCSIPMGHRGDADRILLAFDLGKTAPYANGALAAPRARHTSASVAAPRLLAGAVMAITKCRPRGSTSKVVMHITASTQTFG